MWGKVLISVRKNKIILFSFAALISFSFTLIHMNIDNFILVDQRTIIIHSADITPPQVPETVPNPKPVPVPAPVPRLSSVPVPINRFCRDNLSKSDTSKLYSFVLKESGNVNVIFTKENTVTANVSDYVIDVLNSEGISVTGKEHLVLGWDKNFETGDKYLEAGTYYVKISQGSVYNAGSYRLWVRH